MLLQARTYAYLPGSFLLSWPLFPLQIKPSFRRASWRNYWKKIILLYVVNKVTAQSRHTNGSEIPTEMSLSTESKLRKITFCVGRKIDFLRSLQKGKDKKNYLWCQWCFVCEYFQHFSCSSKGCQPQDLHARDSGRKGSTTQQRAAELKSRFWPVTPAGTSAKDGGQISAQVTTVCGFHFEVPFHLSTLLLCSTGKVRPSHVDTIHVPTYQAQMEMFYHPRNQF